MIALTKTSETTTKISFSWAPVPGCVGYVFFADDKRVSNTWDPSKSTVTFSRTTGGRYRVDAIGVEDSGSWPQPEPPPPPPPPPPTGFASPIAYNNNRSPGFFPPTNVDKYGIVITELARPAGFRGLHMMYRSGITCGANNTNLFESQCLANGWQMVGTNGQVLRNGSYGGVLADPGLPAYQQAWCQESLKKANLIGAKGFWIDDTTPRVTDFTGGVWPQKYPSMDAYKAALLSFAKAVYEFFDPKGFRTSYNTGLSLDDRGLLAAEWWPRIAPFTHYLTEEYWLNAAGSGTIRRAGPEWFNNWDGHRALHRVCLAAGRGFLPWMGGNGTQLQTYALGTFLLDWNGTVDGGACAWIDTNKYNTTTDPWVPFYGQAFALGAPSGPATKSGNTWSRQFANGRVTVDPVAGTAAIT